MSIIIQLFIHACMHAPIHLLICSSTHLPIHPLHLSIQPSSHPPVHLIYASLHLCFHPSIHLSTHPALIHLPNHLSIYLHIHAFIHSLIHPFTHPPIHPSTHPSIYSCLVHRESHLLQAHSWRQKTQNRNGMMCLVHLIKAIGRKKSCLKS